MESIIGCIAQVRSIMATPAMKNVTNPLMPELLPGLAVNATAELESFVLATLASTYHGIGACRMGNAGDPTAVVDSNFRVLGINYLRVVDASVIPHPFPVNPSATVYMLAEYVSDLLKIQSPIPRNYSSSSNLSAASSLVPTINLTKVCYGVLSLLMSWL